MTRTCRSSPAALMTPAPNFELRLPGEPDNQPDRRCRAAG